MNNTNKISKKNKRTRLLQIVRIVRNYNMIYNFIHQTNAAQFKEALEKLGPTFIKAGQLLSTRPDLVSPSYIKELKKLQDSVEIDDYSTVSKTFKLETGHSINETFQYFDKIPFASASIGQTHHAILKNGTKVVVKIQHPNIEKIVKTDMALFHEALKILKFIPDMSVFNAKDTLLEIKNALLNEINTKKEIENGIKFYKLNNNDGIIKVPKVYKKYSASKVLVNQDMQGKSIKFLISNKNKKLIKIRKYMAKTLIRNFIKQVFIDNFFHADPHPGNILFYKINNKNKVKYQKLNQITKNIGNKTFNIETQEKLPPYRLVYLDFGIMGQLSNGMIEGITNIIISLNTKNPRNIGKSILSVCNKIGEVNEEDFYESINLFIFPYLKMKIGQIDFMQMLFQIISLCKKNNLQIKPEVTLLFKSFATLESIVAQLDPDISIMDIARPFGVQYLKKQLNLKKYLENFSYETLEIQKLISVTPQKISQILDILSSNETRLTLRFNDQNKFMSYFDKIINRIIITIIISSVILGSSMLVQGGYRHPIVYKLGVLGFIISIIIIIIMTIAEIKQHFKNSKFK